MIFFHFLRGSEVERDEQKIKLRNKLREYAVATFETASVNVAISKKDPENRDQYYFIIEDFELVDAGKGSLKKADVTINVDNKQTLKDVLNGTISEESALLSTQIQVIGGGLIPTLMSRVYGWIRSYGT